jgi:hypothetical protein
MHLYNGASIAMWSTMRNVTVCLLLLLTFGLPALAQTQGIIDSVEIAGVDNQQLSAELRDAIRGLTGQTYNTAVADQLATRIENEIPGTLAAHRVVAAPAAGRVRVVFVVARSTGDDSNVNSQYVVESVEVKGLDRSQYSNAIHEEMQKMVGQRLNNELAEDLRVRLGSEVGHVGRDYFVNQTIERGSMPEHVKVVFEVERTPFLYRVTLGRLVNEKGGISISIGTGKPSGEQDTVEAVEVTGVPRSRVSDTLSAELQMMAGKKIDQLEMDHLLEKLRKELTDDYEVRTQLRGGTQANRVKIVYEVELIPWIPYRTSQERASYHQKQGITVVCCGDPFLSKYTTLNLIFDGDSLIERYKGLSIGLESRELGTRHFGARLQFDTFGVQWKDQTRRFIAATPSAPGLYRSRRALAPSLAFAFNRHVYVTAGANLVQLEMEGPDSHWRSAHAGVASLRYDSKKIERGKTEYYFKGGYEVRTGARNIGSSFSYTRHALDHSSMVKHEKHELQLSLMAGKITGNAPLFERFSLGNTQTLRGWNKYDGDARGGDNVWHYSAEYRFSPFGVFLDQGAFWGNGLPRTTRQTVGLTILEYFGVGMPLNCNGQCGLNFFVNIH